MTDLFDQQLRIKRRDRAANDAVDFLHVRVFEDMVERLSMVRRSFDRVLVLGCISSSLAKQIRARFAQVHFIEPAPRLAARLGADVGSDVSLAIEPGSIDLLLSFNTPAESGDPAETLLRMQLALSPGGLCLGALVGADSLPALREAMRAADDVAGKARPHVHPRLDPGSMTRLLAAADFADPVVDIDRVDIRYPDFRRLVKDLRGMAATNMLAARGAPLSCAAAKAASAAFASRAVDGKTTESIELVHFAAWRSEDNR